MIGVVVMAAVGVAGVNRKKLFIHLINGGIGGVGIGDGVNSGCGGSFIAR